MQIACGNLYFVKAMFTIILHPHWFFKMSQSNICLFQLFTAHLLILIKTKDKAFLQLSFLQGLYKVSVTDCDTDI